MNTTTYLTKIFILWKRGIQKMKENRVLGIIAEYNPFHNGHMYHLQKAKEQSGAQYCICVMSGNFVQRGNTSIVNKWKKAEMALLNGVDLVIELPTTDVTVSWIAAAIASSFWSYRSRCSL